jgi:hypothetical protein
MARWLELSWLAFFFHVQSLTTSSAVSGVPIDLLPLLDLYRKNNVDLWLHDCRQKKTGLFTSYQGLLEPQKQGLPI